MKKIKIFLFAVVGLIFFNCEIKEEITFNKDGSGEIFYTYDMSKMLQEMPESDNDKKDVDTIFDFNKILKDPKFKDSLAALPPKERKKLESLRMMKMKFVVDTKNEKAEMGFGIKFKDINKVKDMFQKIQEAQDIFKPNKQGNPIKKSPLYESLSGKNQKVQYSFNGRNFKRITTIKKEITKEDNEEMDKMINSQNDEISKLFGILKYTITLNFPKKIKKINNKNAVFSNNRKTVSISYGIEEYIKKPKKLNLEIKLAR